MYVPCSISRAKILIIEQSSQRGSVAIGGLVRICDHWMLQPTIIIIAEALMELPCIGL